MGGWTRWMVGGVAAVSLVACGRSSTAPSPPPAAPPPLRVTMDFEALPSPSPPTDGMVIRGCSHVEDGFTVENLRCSLAGGFVSVHMPPDPVDQNSVNRYVGSVSFANFSWDGTTRLTRDGGGTFALVSIELDALNPASSLNPAERSDASRPQAVTFVGTRLDGATVTQVFTTDTLFPRLETFVFRSDFSELTRVEWGQNGPSFHQFDNLVVSSRE